MTTDAQTTTECARPEQSVEATWNSLTGFDEIAITKAFGESPFTLREQPTTWMRSLAFVLFRRQGAKDAEAYGAAMALTLGVLEDYFPPEPEEFDPEDPTSAEGKSPTPSA